MWLRNYEVDIMEIAIYVIAYLLIAFIFMVGAELLNPDDDFNGLWAIGWPATIMTFGTILAFASPFLFMGGMGWLFKQAFNFIVKGTKNER